MNGKNIYIVCLVCSCAWFNACSEPDQAPEHRAPPPNRPSTSTASDRAEKSSAVEDNKPTKATAIYHADDKIDAKVLGLPLYPNAKVLNSGTWDLNGPGEGSEALVSLQLTTTDPLHKVVTFYREQVQHAQFIEIERAGGKRVSVIVSLPDQTTASAVIRESPPGTAIEITKLASSGSAVQSKPAE